MKNIGSYWSKWDLHVHTPDSIIEHYGKHKESIWDDYIADLNNLPETVSVLGINDYLFLDGYKKVKQYFDEGKLPKIKKLLPVIELRLKIFGNQSKSDAWHRINFHVIFSDELDVDTIQSQFIAGLSAHYNLLPENQSHWNGVLTKQSLEDFGRLIIQNATAPIKESSLEVGFNSLNFTEEGIFNLLKNNHYFKDKYLTAIGKTEWDKLRWDGSIAEKMHIINSVDYVFTASENVEGYKKSENILQAQISQFNLLDCSDAHHFSQSTEKDRIGNCNLWLKAEPTFEGLKQLKYEPKYRKLVSDVEPRKPHRTIESVTFNFPDTTKLKNNNTGIDQPFCLTNLKDEIFFSPYFTCIIGGRGSGKSTIINIIAEKLGEKTIFFDNNKILSEQTDVLKSNGETYINIKGTSEIEFISQGRVEELSEGSHLTDLIFKERIKSVGEDYTEKETQLSERFKHIENAIKTIEEINVLAISLATKRSSLENDQKIVSSIENEEYKALSARVTALSKEIDQLTNSRNQYAKFLEGLKDFLLNTQLSDDAQDEYANRIRDIIIQLETISEISKTDDGYAINLQVFVATDQIIDDRKQELLNTKQQVIDYFTSIGTTQDSIADVGRATSNISTVSNEITEIEKQINTKRELLDTLSKSASDIAEIAKECQDIIRQRLEKINSQLDVKNDNVEKIKFNYQFNQTIFTQILNANFREQFKAYHKSGVSWDNIYWCLNLIAPDENLLKMTHEEYLNALTQKSFDRNSLYGRIFTEIIENKSKFEIYKFLIKKNLYDISKNVEIIGYYGKSPLTSCSFGQRCTAVVITLLMTGVKPLLIDEPEAHLDNRLIAEYLVDLIKEKKNERQIIFATHNANFVINGDSELIHILEIPKESVFTELTSTTIENLNHRKSLLKLEGGEDAFKKRDQKLLSSVRK